MKRIAGLALLVFAAAVFGVVISFGLLEQDILSTALTLFEYFPIAFGVNPTSTMEGALWLGRFTTVIQIVAAGVIVNKKFSMTTRVIAGIALSLATPFDVWTDVVHRSEYLTGNVYVSLAITVAYYTFGSEVMQGLAWGVIFLYWREAISDLIWGILRLVDGMKSIKREVNKFAAASRRREDRDLEDRAKSKFGASYGQAHQNPHRVNPDPRFDKKRKFN